MTPSKGKTKTIHFNHFDRVASDALLYLSAILHAPHRSDNSLSIAARINDNSLKFMWQQYLFRFSELLTSIVSFGIPATTIGKQTASEKIHENPFANIRHPFKKLNLRFTPWIFGCTEQTWIFQQKVKLDSLPNIPRNVSFAVDIENVCHSNLNSILFSIRFFDFWIRWFCINTGPRTKRVRKKCEYDTEKLFIYFYFSLSHWTRQQIFVVQSGCNIVRNVSNEQRLEIQQCPDTKKT